MPDIDPRDWDALHDAARKSLGIFTRLGWPELNRGTPLDWSWHTQAICEHLEAVTSGQIKRLIINIPPGMSKTSLVCHSWPVWEWLQMPSNRWGFAAYGAALTYRDNRKRRDLIRSRWFQESFNPQWTVKGDADNIGTFANTETGEMQATSVGGPVTGFHFDRLVCFPADEVVWTEHGRIPIGDIVRQRMAVRVWSTDIQTGETSLQPVVGWVANPGDEIVEVGLDDGSTFRCTPGHLVWTTNRGWVRAGCLRPVDVLPYPANADAEDGRMRNAEPAAKGHAAFAGKGQDLADLVFGKLGIHPLASVSPVCGTQEPRGGGLPGLSAPDLRDDRRRHTISSGERDGRVCAQSNRPGLHGVQLGIGAPLACGKRAVKLGVVDVVRPSPVSQIGQRVVSRVAVYVPDFAPFWARPDECEHHGLVDVYQRHNTLNRGAEPEVSSPLVLQLQDAAPDVDHLVDSSTQYSPGLAPCPPMVRDAICGVSWHRRPTLVRKVGFTHETFCLSVATNGTFVVGSVNGIIIKNCDDPIKADDVYTVKLQRHVEWFESAWKSRTRDKERSAFVIIMQRLHSADIAGVKLKEGGWEHLNLPMEYRKAKHCITSIGWEDPRKTEGEPLCPSRMPPASYAVDKSKARIWAAQYQQDPIVGDGTIFRAAWLQYYFIDKHIEGCVEFPGAENMDKVVTSWDLTFDAGKNNDFNAGTVWGRKGPNVYLIDAVHGQMRFTEQQWAIRRMAKKWPEARRHLIEEKANGAAVLDVLRRPMPDGGSGADGDRDGIPGIIGVVPRGPKVARAEVAAGYFQAGNVYLPHPSIAPWVIDYAAELCSFPTGDFDDFVDSTGQALLDIMRTSQVTEDDYDRILPPAGRVPAPDRIEDDNLTDPRLAEWSAEEARRDAAAEERMKQRERDRIADRLGITLNPGDRFSTRDFGNR